MANSSGAQTPEEALAAFEQELVAELRTRTDPEGRLELYALRDFVQRSVGVLLTAFKDSLAAQAESEESARILFHNAFMKAFEQHVQGWRRHIGNLERDKITTPHLADPSYGQWYGRKRAAEITDPADPLRINETVRTSLDARQRLPILFEYLERERPDLYALSTWPIEALAEAQRAKKEHEAVVALKVWARRNLEGRQPGDPERARLVRLLDALAAIETTQQLRTTLTADMLANPDVQRLLKQYGFRVD